MPNHAPTAPITNAACLSFEQALALDFVLGILRAPLLSQAKHRLLDDDAFRHLVDGYREMLESLASPTASEECASEMPTSDLWAAIEARIARPTSG